LGALAGWSELSGIWDGLAGLIWRAKWSRGVRGSG